MNKRNLAVMASCMLLYTSFAYAANVEETQNSGDSVAAEKTNQNDTQLDEVVVTDSKLNPLKIPVRMTVVTAEQIKAKGAQTVADALKDVAGLNVNNSMAKGKGVGQIRGSDSSSTKVIVDGVMINGGGDGRADLSVIPTDNIEKIEIFKGPVPVLYGSNAPGGVIFITTKNASGQSSGALTVAGGSWDTRLYSLSLSGKADKVSYYLAGKKYNTDGYNDNPDNIRNSAGQIYARNTAEDAKYFNGKLKWDIDPKSSLTVFGSYSDSTKELPNRYGYYNGTEILLPYPGSGGTITARNNYYGGGNSTKPNIGSGATSYNWAYEPTKESYIGAVYDLKPNDANDISLKFYRSTLKSLLTVEQVPGGTGFGWKTMDWDGSINGYELQHTIKTSRVNTATWGYAYETRSFTELTPRDATHTTFNRGTYDYTGKSFYIQDVTNISPKLSTSFGYRHDEIDDSIIVNTTAYAPTHPNWQTTYTSDVPVFSLTYKLSGNTSIHGAIGKSFRSPNAAEACAPVATSNLVPEEGINREVGLSTTKSGLDFDVTFFTRDITNMIKSQSGGGHSSYYNIPNVEMHGYEAEISKKISQHLKGFVNYSYTNSYDTLMRMQVSDVPYRKYSYGLNYTEKGLTANMAVNYVGARRSMFSQGNGNGSDDGNGDVTGNPYGYWGTKNLPGYHVVDLKVSKAIDNKEYYVKVLNLFDKEYYTGSYMVAPGRYVEVGTTVRF